MLETQARPYHTYLRVGSLCTIHPKMNTLSVFCLLPALTPANPALLGKVPRVFPFKYQLASVGAETCAGIFLHCEYYSVL